MLKAMSSNGASDPSAARPLAAGARVRARARLDPRQASRTEFEDEERLSRQRAAERLVDIAYALTGGDMLGLRRRDRQVSVPVADEVRLTRRCTATGERVEMDVRLSWTATRAHTGA
jgi:amphi-Trp domain-containing protein